MYLCVYVGMYAYMYMCALIDMCEHVCGYVHMYVNMYICRCGCVSIHSLHSIACIYALKFSVDRPIYVFRWFFSKNNIK